VVWVAAGSEDSQFFTDPAVQAVFTKNGYRVNDIPAGSLFMASPKFCRAGYDLLVPSSSVIADQVLQQPKAGILDKKPAFTTPLVALTWQPLVAPLINARLASRNSDGTYTFHLGAFLSATQRKLLWSDIAPSVFSQKRLFQALFSDPRQSNSGAMVIAAASYVLYGAGVPVADQAAISKVTPQLKDLLASMGYTEGGSDPVVDNYLTAYMRGAPLVFTYESEFIDRVLSAEPGLRKSGVPEPVMMYLEPTVWSARTLLPRNDRGKAVENLLTGPQLQPLEEKHGFRQPDGTRPGDPGHGVAGAPQVDTAQPPKLHDLETLIDAITPPITPAPSVTCPPPH
jgi:hypothetical protein